MTSVLHKHLHELLKLYDRMEPDHIARDRIQARIEECREAIRADEHIVRNA